MRIIELKAENFRNIENETLSFDIGTNLIFGNNAEGKTNIVEAIYYFANSKSFRTSSDKELIRFGCDEARLTAIFEDGGRKYQYDVVISKANKRAFYYNKIKITKMSEFFGNFRAVLFVPEHLKIVKNGPGERRALIDSSLCQLKKSYISELYRYTKLASEKNALLRDYKGGEYENTMLDIYDENLIISSAKISETRKEYSSELFERAKKHLFDMSGDRLEFSYKMSGLSGDRDAMTFYKELIPASRKRDIAYHSITAGAGRDDIEIFVNGTNLRQYGSQGQQRSAVVAMKLAEGELAEEKTKSAPIYLFDDILSELDEHRREYILSKLRDKQVIVTSCLGDEEGIYSGKRIFVEKGKYR
ncbi:MAG: DNA replication/repair protein RecF [Ruminococcaceae bacterium]|nr:DNA replication/repair protein RecF [Oscillospiraceae bacterium]